MKIAVIDTNVLLVANGSHEDVSNACQKKCIERLLDQKASGITVIDDSYRILSEYLNKTHPNQPKGVGDVFLKWLLQNQRNTNHVQQVALIETAEHVFAEFPDAALQEVFDAPDRKFAAVANAHPDSPPVWQAADCKWLDWWPTLKEKGVVVEFLCPDDACKFYTKKFPTKATPSLPD